MEKKSLTKSKLIQKKEFKNRAFPSDFKTCKVLFMQKKKKKRMLDQ